MSVPVNILPVYLIVIFAMISTVPLPIFGQPHTDLEIAELKLS